MDRDPSCEQRSARDGQAIVAGLERSHPNAPARRAISKVERAVARAMGGLPCSPGDLLLIALSGGPDSVAILYALKRSDARTGYRLAAAHLNHGIRRTEAARDECFVRELCARLGLELIVEHARTLGPPNLEEHAREVRYDFLNRAADLLGARFIILGHHRGDQAETVLLRLLRGTGIAGLSAMAERGPGRLVRPMLSLERSTILAYLDAIGAEYVIDSSNLEPAALRNRLRRELIPKLEHDYAPGIEGHLAELAAELREADEFITAEARRTLDAMLLTHCDADGKCESWRVDLREFASIRPVLRNAVMRELLRRAVGNLRRIQRVHIMAMRRLAESDNPSAMVVLPRGWCFRREYQMAVLESCRPSVPRAFAATLRPGENLLAGPRLMFSLREFQAGAPNSPPPPFHPSTRFEAYFDAAETSGLSVRSVLPGDRIQPLGMTGSRKVHDVLIDCKVAEPKRGLWPLVVTRDAVLWIPGLVRSRNALVTLASKKILHLRADPFPGLQNV